MGATRRRGTRTRRARSPVMHVSMHTGEPVGQFLEEKSGQTKGSVARY